MDVGFHDGRIGADDVGADRLLRNSIPAQQFVDVLPGFRLDGEEALVQEAEVHHRPLPHAQEVLEERLAADADDGVTKGQPFAVLDDQGSQDVLRGVVCPASRGVSLGKFQQVLVYGGKNLAIGVEHLTDGPVSGTIVTNDSWQSLVTGFKTQHGFHFLTHPCSPWRLGKRSCHKDKDASFLYKPDRPNIGP